METESTNSKKSSVHCSTDEPIYEIDYRNRDILYALPNSNLPSKFLLLGCSPLSDKILISVMESLQTYHQIILYKTRKDIDFREIDSPIRNINDICFCTIDSKHIWKNKRLIKCSDEIISEIFYIMGGGCVYNDVVDADVRRRGYGNIKYTKIRLDPDRNIIVAANDDFFTFDDCYVALYHDQISYRKYKVKIVKLTTCEPFASEISLPEYYKIKSIKPNLKNMITIINDCRKLFYVNGVNHIIVKCVGGTVEVPLFLKPMFGDHSPIFHQKEWSNSLNDCHDVNFKSFKLIVQWLFMLFLEQKYPDVDMIIQNETNVYEWIHISNYFDIPFFLDYFTKIRECLSNK